MSKTTEAQEDFIKSRPVVDDSLSYKERIENKDEHEDFLWGKIKDQVPWVIEKANSSDDKRGVDAWITALKGGAKTNRKSIQLKMRQYGGDDVLVEMVRPWPPKDPDNPWTGRDIKTKVDYYFSVSTKGELRIFKAAVLKDAAKDMCTKFMQKAQKKPNLQSFKVPEGEAKVITDPSEESMHGMGKVQKLVAFVNPAVLKPTYFIQL